MPEIAPFWWWNNLDIVARTEFCSAFSRVNGELCSFMRHGGTEIYHCALFFLSITLDTTKFNKE
jgi:hypothetical protein